MERRTKGRGFAWQGLSGRFCFGEAAYSGRKRRAQWPSFSKNRCWPRASRGGKPRRPRGAGAAKGRGRMPMGGSFGPLDGGAHVGGNHGGGHR